MAFLHNTEVIAVNQDPLGVQGKKVAFVPSQLTNVSSDVIVSELFISLIQTLNQNGFQWTYNAQDGSIRSALEWSLPVN